MKLLLNIRLVIFIWCLFTIFQESSCFSRVLFRRQQHVNAINDRSTSSLKKTVAVHLLGNSFEFGSSDHGGSSSSNKNNNREGGGSHNEFGSSSKACSSVSSQNSAGGSTCTQDMVRLTPCYFDGRRGCQSGKSICPIDGRRCNADRSYLDEEYGARVFEDIQASIKLQEEKEEEKLEMYERMEEEREQLVQQFKEKDQDQLLYTFWGGDLTNSTRHEEGGSHQELS